MGVFFWFPLMQLLFLWDFAACENATVPYGISWNLQSFHFSHLVENLFFMLYFLAVLYIFISLLLVFEICQHRIFKNSENLKILTNLQSIQEKHTISQQDIWRDTYVVIYSYKNQLTIPMPHFGSTEYLTQIPHLSKRCFAQAIGFYFLPYKWNNLL